MSQMLCCYVDIYVLLTVPGGSIDGWLVQRATQTFSRVLARRYNHNDYPDNTDILGRWGEIQSQDTIYICTRGVDTSMSKVGWASKAGVVKWNAQQVTEVFTANMSAANRPLHLILDIHLTACWGANYFTVLVDSLGKKLSKKLNKAGLMGTLNADKGATQLTPYGD